jgi:hypothetical protein
MKATTLVIIIIVKTSNLKTFADNEMTEAILRLPRHLDVCFQRVPYSHVIFYDFLRFLMVASCDFYDTVVRT